MRILLLCLLPVTALAQVVTNDQALQALKPAAPAPVHKPAVAAPPPRHAARRTAARPAKAAPLPLVPNAPPPNPVILPPPAIIPVHAPPSPPPIRLVPDAPTIATALDGGTRLVFGPGSAELNQPSFDAIETIAAAAKADPQKEITVTAWAPGAAEDPSTPHRLSLDRALAARAVLIHAGIASERIHAVAKGFNDIGAASPDRADIVAGRPKSAPAKSTAAGPAHS